MPGMTHERPYLPQVGLESNQYFAVLFVKAQRGPHAKPLVSVGALLGPTDPGSGNNVT